MKSDKIYTHKWLPMDGKYHHVEVVAFLGNTDEGGTEGPKTQWWVDGVEMPEWEGPSSLSADHPGGTP